MASQIMILGQKIKHIHFHTMVDYFKRSAQTQEIFIDQADAFPKIKLAIQENRIDLVILCNWFVYRADYMERLHDLLAAQKIPVVIFTYDWIPSNWHNYLKNRWTNVGYIFVAQSCMEIWSSYVDPNSRIDFIHGLGPNKVQQSYPQELTDTLSSRHLVNNVAVYCPINPNWQNDTLENVEALIQRLPKNIKGLVDDCISDTNYDLNYKIHHALAARQTQHDVNFENPELILNVLRLVCLFNQLWRRRRLIEQLVKFKSVVINPAQVDPYTAKILNSGRARTVIGVNKDATKILMRAATAVLSTAWENDFLHDRVDTTLAVGSQALVENIMAHDPTVIRQQDRLIKFDYEHHSIRMAIEQAIELHDGGPHEFAEINRLPEFEKIREMGKKLAADMA
ncbi:hypothetical protein N9L79_04830 [Alphaproteobacteria bacterium]|nr:hypothetical protein [Alphaproteobacteria bacterium]